MQKIIPNLWFENQAEEAAQLYTSVFANSKMGKIARYGKSGAEVSGQKEGSVLTASFQIEGLEVIGINGGPYFKHTPALSFFVWCETEKDLDQKWAQLSKGGQVLMGLDKYPFAEKYGWCADKYGVNWQLMLSDRHPQKIAPAFLFVQDKFGKGEEAIGFYVSLFKNSKIETLARDEASKSILYGEFYLHGQKFVAMESGMKEHQYTFSPAMSFMVKCEDQQEVDRFWEKLSQGGATEQCGWLKDKYGVSWQVVPSVLETLLNNSDSEKAEKVMKTLLQMKKINIETLMKV